MNDHLNNLFDSMLRELGEGDFYILRNDLLLVVFLGGASHTKFLDLLGHEQLLNLVQNTLLTELLVLLLSGFSRGSMGRPMTGLRSIYLLPMQSLELLLGANNGQANTWRGRESGSSLLLGVNNWSLHFDDSGLLVDNTILALGLVVLLNHLTIGSSLKRLARNLGVAVDAAQDAVGEVSWWCSTARWRSRSVIHFLPKGSETVRRSDSISPNTSLQLVLGLLSLDLHLEALHETLTIQDTLHTSRVFRGCSLATDASSGIGALESLGSSDILGVSKHQVQFSGLQLVSLGFLGSHRLHAIQFSLEPICLSPLSIDKPSLFLQLPLQLGNQSIGSQFKLGLHLITLSHSGLGNLSRFERLILGLSGFRVCVQLIEQTLDSEIETLLEVHVRQPPIHGNIAQHGIHQLKHS
ncbi:hypothetical protein HG530_009120 [Fusarium avenaceum]|nr:hypothetical protein HG530_009120 [Fusarium avenaceum]